MKRVLILGLIGLFMPVCGYCSDKLTNDAIYSSLQEGTSANMVSALSDVFEELGFGRLNVQFKFGDQFTPSSNYLPGQALVEVPELLHPRKEYAGQLYWEMWSDALTDGQWKSRTAFENEAQMYLLGNYTIMMFTINEMAHDITYRHAMAKPNQATEELRADQLTLMVMQSINSDARLKGLYKLYQAKILEELLMTLQADQAYQSIPSRAIEQYVGVHNIRETASLLNRIAYQWGRQKALQQIKLSPKKFAEQYMASHRLALTAATQYRSTFQSMNKQQTLPQEFLKHSGWTDRSCLLLSGQVVHTAVGNGERGPTIYCYTAVAEGAQTIGHFDVKDILPASYYTLGDIQDFYWLNPDRAFVMFKPIKAGDREGASVDHRVRMFEFYRKNGQVITEEVHIKMKSFGDERHLRVIGTVEDQIVFSWIEDRAEGASWRTGHLDYSNRIVVLSTLVIAPGETLGSLKDGTLDVAPNTPALFEQCLVGPDGAIYFPYRDQVKRIEDGTMTTIAGFERGNASDLKGNCLMGPVLLGFLPKGELLLLVAEHQDDGATVLARKVVLE